MTVVIRAWPYAAPTPSGRAGAYGLHHSAAVRTDTGARIQACGINEPAARRQARREALRQWGEVLAFLDEETRYQEALDAGDVELPD